MSAAADTTALPATRLVCMDCGAEAPSAAVECPCGGLLDAVHPRTPVNAALFAARRGALSGPDRSGVWRYRELVHPAAAAGEVVTRGEGNTGTYEHPLLSRYVGAAQVRAKHEGENPTGSFKDRGMTVGVTEARRLGARVVACASTGNTSASLAAYAAAAGLRAAVFVPAGKVALGKMAQSVAYGARVLEVEGSFDDALRAVRRACATLDVYLLNSVNPWRVEGQKAIVFEVLEETGWEAPDWIVFPAGNLGNCSAFGKALADARAAGLVARLPRLAAVQAAGAAPFYRMWRQGTDRLEPEPRPETVATAIRIGAPASWKRAARAIRATGGTVTAVDDREILDAKALVDACGIGCEPASAAAVAGARRLVGEGVIAREARVVLVLTGHLLKDPQAVADYHASGAPRANPPLRVAGDPEDVRRALGL